MTNHRRYRPLIAPAGMVFLLLLASGCATSTPVGTTDPPGTDAPAPTAPAPAPEILLTPEEQATDDVSAFMGAYISAIMAARAQAKALDRPVCIRIERAEHRVAVLDGVATPGQQPLATYGFAKSIEILKEPESVVVGPDAIIAFTGRDFAHPLPQKETAHVLAWVPKFAPHAFFRFAKGKRDFLAQQTSYIDEAGD